MALVLAIDVSGSVDDNRFKLQREGIAVALDSEEVAAAVLSGVNRTIEIAGRGARMKIGEGGRTGEWTTLSAR
ncbi:MAG TPA: DUF1194 domain-containing protein [Xanthobacteraceae bacterium]|nr:DUF1194 domain-containing protein [Xanthobacteraceae bacterium]